MQTTVRWSSNRLDGAVVGRFLGTPGSNKSDANVEDSDCTVGMTLTAQCECCYSSQLLRGGSLLARFCGLLITEILLKSTERQKNTKK